MTKFIYDKLDKKVKEKIKIVKRIFIGTVLLGICGGIGVGVLGMRWMKNQINYTEAQAKQIAVETVAGTILDVHKEIDDLLLVYEIKIKDEDNKLHEVEVNSKYGTIEIDNDTWID